MSKIAYDSPLCIIGLGRFGLACAKEALKLGREVLGVDIDKSLAQKLSNQLTWAVSGDIRDIEVLEEIGIKDYDIVVVAVGNLEASILAVSHLSSLKIKHIWAKAVNSQHGQILQQVGAHHIIYPEAEAGRTIAHLVGERMIDYIQFAGDFAVAKLITPKSLINKSPEEIYKKYKVQIIKRFEHTPSMGTSQSSIIVAGSVRDVEKFANKS